MSSPAEDPLLTSARREAIIVFFVWGCALAYTVSYCFLFGYNRSLDDLKFVWGFPDWIFWGVVAPWTASVLFSLFFAEFYMSDDDLGQDSEENAEVADHGGNADHA